jgi:hypothetical protein
MKDEKFSIVPQELTSNPLYNNGEFRVLVAILGKYNIHPKTGHPFTVSVGSLSKDTAMANSTVRGHIKKLVELGILYYYGKLLSSKTEYPIYGFKKDVFDKLQLTVSASVVVKDDTTENGQIDVDELSLSASVVVKDNNNKGQTDIDGLSKSAFGTEVGTEVETETHTRSNIGKRNILEVKSVEGIFEPSSNSTDIILSQMKEAVQKGNSFKEEEIEHDSLYLEINKSYSLYSIGWRQAVKELNKQYPNLAIDLK